MFILQVLLAQHFHTTGPPTFTTTPSNSSVVVGGTIQLPCTGDGNPIPSLTWWRQGEGGANNSQVESNGQFFVTTDSLLVVSTSILNEGFYYCNLSSTVGPPILSQTVFLDVLSE